jgi:hypothetical protein
MESPDRPVAIAVVTAHNIVEMLRPAFYQFFERRPYLPVEE